MIVVTGGAGFIGSNFIHDWFAHADEPLVNIDKLTYAGNLDNLADISGRAGYSFLRADIGDQLAMSNVFDGEPRAVINFAAESHVDRSIKSPGEFIQTNIVGTFNLLECALAYWRSLSPSDQRNFLFVHISTDEVYGSLEQNEPKFTEKSAYQPNSPYASSKASSDHLVRSYHKTYGLPCIITNCSNNFGPRQFPEKLIPLTIMNALSGKDIPIYGDGMQRRDWLYVVDHCQAIRRVLNEGSPGKVYNIGGNAELTNIEVVSLICDVLSTRTEKSGEEYKSQIRFVEDRPGHDTRYSVDIHYIKESLDWQPFFTTRSGLELTVDWYLNNTQWLNNVASGAYREWIESHYGQNTL